MPSVRDAPRDDAVAASPTRILLGAVALLGSAALVVATFTDVIVVRQSDRTLASDTGLDRHSVALLLLAAAAVVLVALTFRYASRAAALGLAFVGLVTILLAVLGDVPDLGKSGQYADVGLAASTRAGAGFFAETTGGALLMLAGGLLFLTSRRD